MTDDADRPGDDGHRPDSAVRAALCDLIPDYRGPADPLLRVGASIRRRRSRRRALLAIGSAAAAVTLVAGVPAVLTAIGPGPGGRPAGDGSATSGPDAPLPPPVVHAVNQGVVAGSAWQAGSTSPGGAARRCLLVDGGGFARDMLCFDEWRAGDPVSWHAVVVRPGSRPVTRVAGVAPPDAAAVEIRLATGRPVRIRAIRTPTDPVARFFAVLLDGELAVRSVAAVGPDGTLLGPPVTEPAPTTCRTAPDNACASPDPTD
jgi:hypothetical protein